MKPIIEFCSPTIFPLSFERAHSLSLTHTLPPSLSIPLLDSVSLRQPLTLLLQDVRSIVQVE